MAEVSDSPSAEHPDSNDRYRVQALIGRGGMALVYEATDRANGRRVALKRLQDLADPTRQQRNLELFEREFHTLSQLAHPRIVRVFDFGIDARGAYYAMELLEGGDLQELAPLPWRRACAIARDVCSALSIVHSRRFVHRDVSPRNVRCRKDGPAKLIDFGAMAPAGPTKLIVGTPPCCAPESVHLQTLDGRTDLFGLGATLYYMLVGHHAYAARQLNSLKVAWASGFARPSELVPEIPPELDALVTDLLRLEPDARPASATEVMERLSAIDGEAATEQLQAAEAYLATPTLVGRDDALERVRRRVNRPTGGRSRSVVVEGAAGVGRTRFLDACLLDATLAGQVIVRADSDDAASGDYGVVRAIARQLLQALPQLARETAAPVFERIAPLIPDLAYEGQPVPANDVVLVRPHLQRALHEWLTSLSKHRPFVLAVDDFHRIDEPSAALIALLERDSTEHELCLLITIETGATWTAEAAGKLLSPLTTLRLEPLNPADSEKLLRSVFGSVPNVELLAHSVRELTAGSPRELLRLAQHLVDRGTVRYAAGGWTLPSHIDPGDLPTSMSDALLARIAALPERARDLARAFALCPDQAFSFDECGRLNAEPDHAARVAQLEALISADIARSADTDVKLAQRSWVPLLRATLTPDRVPVFERRLAELFERRSGQEFRAAQHWFRADEPRRALDLLVVHAAASLDSHRQGPELFLRYLLSLPEGWFETLQQGMRACDELGRPRAHKHVLLARVIGMMALLNTHASDLYGELFATLCRDSGYDDWQALDPNMDPQQRLTTALRSAQERYNALPEDERVLDVVSAIRNLARAVVAALGPISMTLDLEALRSLPRFSLFTSLSPALDAGNKLFLGVEARITGRIPRARQVYDSLLEQLQRPDRAGFDESHAEYTKLGVMNGVGIIEAGLGLGSCLDWADKLSTHPAYEVNATVIRMLHCVFQGDVEGAEKHKRLADGLRIQNSGRQMYEGGHLIWEIQGHTMSGDLTRVRHASEEIAPLASRYPQWAPVLRYATAEYHRMTRDFERACAELEGVLAAVSVGAHQIWAHAANAHVQVLLELNQVASALNYAEQYAVSAEQTLEYVPDSLQLSLALARSAGGQADAAAAVDALIQRLQALGVTGLHLGVAHETRARIALRTHDMSAFARHTEHCRQSFFAYKNSALTAKYHRLLQDGRRQVSAGSSFERLTSTPESVVSYGGARIELALAGCRDDDQRARLALTLLTRQSGANAGILYLLNGAEPFGAAQVGNVPDASTWIGSVREFLAAQAESSTTTSTESEVSEPAETDWNDETGRAWKPVLLSHYHADTMVIVGLAVLLPPAAGELVLPTQTATAISQFFAGKGAASLTLLED
jgi:hypothetical protein